MMPEMEAHEVKLAGSGIAPDGEHGVLVFTRNGRQLALALGFEQFAGLLKAAALWYSQARKRLGDQIPAIPVESWSTTRSADGAVLSIQVFGGLELRFQVSKGTKDPEAASE